MGRSLRLLPKELESMNAEMEVSHLPRFAAQRLYMMELLIVMAIITVLMLIGFPTYRSVMKHSASCGEEVDADVQQRR